MKPHDKMLEEGSGRGAKEGQSVGFNMFLISALVLFIFFVCHLLSEIRRPYILAKGIPTLAIVQDVYVETEFRYSKQTYFSLEYSSKDGRRWTAEAPVGTSSVNQSGLKVPIHYLEKNPAGATPDNDLGQAASDWGLAVLYFVGVIFAWKINLKYFVRNQQRDTES